MYEVNEIMKYNIGLLKGDGIGPEIVDCAVEVLQAVAKKFGHEFVFTPYLIGGAAIDALGEPLPKETVEGCLSSDSVLLGAVCLAQSLCQTILFFPRYERKDVKTD